MMQDAIPNQAGVWFFEAMKENGIEPELFFIVMIGFGFLLALNEVLITLKNKKNG